MLNSSYKIANEKPDENLKHEKNKQSALNATHHLGIWVVLWADQPYTYDWLCEPT